MASVHNVKRIHRNRLGITPAKSGEYPLKRWYDPKILATCVICGKQWWTIFNFARCCSLKCRNTFNYKRNRKRIIKQMKYYYRKHREEIIKYKHSPHYKELRHKREKWVNYSPEKIEKLKKANKKYQLAHLDKFRDANRRYYKKHKSIAP